MGLLNNWLKKKEKEQLKNATTKKQDVVDAKEDVVEKEVKKVKKTKTSEEKVQKRTLPVGSIAHEILVKPLITEKGAVAESYNKYSFIVARDASKNQIKTAVKDIYGVLPTKVNVVNVQGRTLRFGRSMGRRSDYKKAIVTLPAGKSIDIHAGV